MMSRLLPLNMQGFKYKEVLPATTYHKGGEVSDKRIKITHLQETIHMVSGNINRLIYSPLST